MSMSSSWEVVDISGMFSPTNRSLHAGAQVGDSFYIFGGYDGNARVNDFYEFHFPTKRWNLLPPSDTDFVPSPRDRHSAVVFGRTFYVFGGFDGTNRKNDFYGYNLDTQTWSLVPVSTGHAPSSRHSHCAVVYDKSMWIFGGYDSSYKNDLHEYNFASEAWGIVICSGRLPRARYRATCVIYNNSMIMFGGHDGSRHLNVSTFAVSSF
jgi:leucine-zipper-like transcriptional regulator 1